MGNHLSARFFLATLALLDLFMAVSLGRMSQGFRIEALDVGQGDAIVLITPQDHHILIDGGPDLQVLTELGEALPPAFREIDLLVLTHPHADHVVGLIEVLERFDVAAVLLSGPAYETEEYEVFMETLVEENLQVYFAEAGMDFSFGALSLDVLYPFNPMTGTKMDNVNNASVVMKATWEAEMKKGEESPSVLLMGDAEQEVEAELVNVYGEEELLEAQLLKAGHHGSKTSSTAIFLEAVSPETMVISCGTGNSYGHPSPSTLKTANQLGINVLRTDLMGRVSLEFESGEEGFFYSWIRSIFAPRVRSFSSSFS